MVDATHHGDGEGQTRRDFLYLAAGAIGAVGSAGVAWELINSMNPAADTLALSTIDVNLAPIAEGMGVPARRVGTAEELADALVWAFGEPGPHVIEAIMPSIAG